MRPITRLAILSAFALSVLAGCSKGEEPRARDDCKEIIQVFKGYNSGQLGEFEEEMDPRSLLTAKKLIGSVQEEPTREGLYDPNDKKTRPPVRNEGDNKWGIDSLDTWYLKERNPNKWGPAILTTARIKCDSEGRLEYFGQRDNLSRPSGMVEIACRFDYSNEGPVQPFSCYGSSPDERSSTELDYVHHAGTSLTIAEGRIKLKRSSPLEKYMTKIESK